jgi:hypothetical protein
VVRVRWLLMHPGRVGLGILMMGIYVRIWHHLCGRSLVAREEGMGAMGGLTGGRGTARGERVGRYKFCYLSPVTGRCGSLGLSVMSGKDESYSSVRIICNRFEKRIVRLKWWRAENWKTRVLLHT